MRRQKLSEEVRRQILDMIRSGTIAPGGMGPRNPVAQAAGIFDASSHETLAHLQQYATGRSVPDSARP